MTDILSTAPLIVHLRELRKRLIYTVIFFVIAVGICFHFADIIFMILLEPLKHALGENIKVTYWAPHEAFFSYMNLAIYSGFCLSFPLIMSQIWAFIAPGLYAHEKKAFLPFLLMTPVMFILGAMMAYYVVLPTALSFFAGFQTPLGTIGGTQIVQETRVSEYLSFALSFILIFGATFELPIGLILAGRVGLISATTLQEKRSYAIFAIAVFSALVTPPDMISMAGLGIPLYIMFEISILSIASFEHKRDKEV